jgi:hypothetical protein
METLKLFNNLSKKQFLNDAKYFASEKRAELVTRFNTWAVNCVQRCYEYGDIKWANKAYVAAELCGYGPTFRRCFVPNIPFACDKEARLFVGQIQTGKRAALNQLDENGVLRFEADIAKRLADEGKPKEKKEPDYAKRIASAVAAAVKHGMSPLDIRKLVSETVSKTITTVKVDVAEKKAA